MRTVQTGPIVATLLLMLTSATVAQTNCLRTSREIAPQLSPETRQDLESKLAQTQTDFKNNPNADNHVWIGRRTAYLGRYKEAIGIYSAAIKKFPSDARLYRHRGHRLLTLRCFDDAIVDFEKAAKLIKGKPDEIEPDGMPNARNTPTSSLQSNIWYHLGLARYLKGDFRGALAAYREAEKVSKNPDMQVATAHWLYMTLRRLGREDDAKKAIGGIGDNLDIIENADYYKLIKLYQGKLKPTDLLPATGEAADSLSNATLGYGVGNWFLYNGRRTEAEKIFRQIMARNQWASFGYIAAETELARGPQWRAYSPPDKSFILRLPVPLRLVSSADLDQGAIPEVDQELDWAKGYAGIDKPTDDDPRFALIIVDKQSDRSFFSPEKREDYLQYLAWIFLGDEDETQFMRKPTPVRQNGLQGRDYIYVKISQHQGNMFIRGRMFETSRRVFVVKFVGSDEKDLWSSDAKLFLSSFRLRPIRN